MSIFLESIIDTLKMAPFLFGSYLLLEWLAHRAGGHARETLGRARRFGPLVGAVLGLFPQCGFSVAAAGLYADRVITPGALVAVFLSTSDEALPMLLNPSGAGAILPLVVVKVAIAAFTGLLIDFGFGWIWRGTWRREDETCHSHEHFAHDHEDEEHCHHSHCQEGSIGMIALRHTLRVAALVFAVTLALNLALELLGEDRVSGLLMSGRRVQPLAAALFGLLPSCAASVMLARLYLADAITFGSVVAGLATGAGMGSLVLVQACRRKWEALLILLVLFAVGAASGVAIDAFGWQR